MIRPKMRKEEMILRFAEGRKEEDEAAAGKRGRRGGIVPGPGFESRKYTGK